MDKIKQLYQVFTTKELFIDWILAVLKALTLYFLKIKAKDNNGNNSVVKNNVKDMRTTSPAMKKAMIYDEDVLNERWSACSTCEFLTNSETCTKCGCFMKVKHKLKMAECPVGKWGKYIEKPVTKIPAMARQ